MNIVTLLNGIARRDKQGAGIRCRRLFQMKTSYVAALCRDVERLCSEQQPSDVARTDHVTHWTLPFGKVRQYSLLNSSGRYDDFSTDHNLSCFGKRCHATRMYPVLGEFVEAFAHTVNFRINVLGPRSGLSPHEEQVLFRTRIGSVGAKLRFHLPLFTNPQSELMLDGFVYHLAAGTVYFVNHGCVHSATNGDLSPRIHLAWDMLLTRETFDDMFGNGAVPHPHLTRVAQGDSEPVPLRRVRIGAYRRLPLSLGPEAAARLDLCEIQ